MQTFQSEFTSIPAPPAAVVTSYGYALCLELGGEPILLELQRSLELLTTKASRLETRLLAQGWEIAAA